MESQQNNTGDDMREIANACVLATIGLVVAVLLSMLCLPTKADCFVVKKSETLKRN